MDYAVAVKSLSGRKARWRIVCAGQKKQYTRESIGIVESRFAACRPVISDKDGADRFVKKLTGLFGAQFKLRPVPVDVEHRRFGIL